MTVPDSPQEPAPATAPRGGIARHWLRRADAHAEWAIVLLMVVSAVASAVAFYNATQLSERAGDLANDARFAATLESQRLSRANTILAHDQRVALSCASAVRARDVALADYSQHFAAERRREAVAAEQRRIALGALLIDPQDCAGYDVRQAFERLSSPDLGSDDEDWRTLLAQGERSSAAEPLAVGAAVLFAVVLLLLTLADQSSRPRWVRAWLGAALLVAVAAGWLSAASVAHAAEQAGRVIPILVLIALVLVLFLVVTRRRRLVPRTAAPARVAARARRGAGARLSRLPVEGTWWAEVLGAATLVAFAVTVLGLSGSSAGERAALIDADRYALEARQALELGEQAALGVLVFTEEIATLEASSASADVSQGADAAPRLEVTRAGVLDRWEAERTAWELRIADAIATTRGDTAARAEGGRPWEGCLDPAQILPWLASGVDPAVALPVAVRTRQAVDDAALRSLVNGSTTGAARCATQAAVSRTEARAWGDSSSGYTVALLVLGLAGFLFALASDRDRTPWPRRWLLASALVGITIGVAITGLTWSGTPSPRDATAQGDAASAFARARLAIDAGDCDTAVTEAELAGRTLTDLPQAAILQADAVSCSPDGSWVIAPYLAADRLDAFRGALERAYADGHASSGDREDTRATISLGWANLLAALEHPGDQGRAEMLARAAALTRAGLRADGSQPWACFNLALGALAAGDPAAVGLYRDALTATRGARLEGSSCPAYRTNQPVMRDLVVLSALADLELLPDANEVVGIRELLMGDGSPAADAPSSTTGLSLATWPQQIGVSVEPGAPLADRDVAVVWYWRPSDAVPWGVVYGPSLSTMRPGLHLDGAWSLGRVLASGQYAADVYVDGGLAGRLTTKQDWWAANGLDAADWRWVQAPSVGLSLVVPRDWALVDETEGREIRYGSGDDAVALQRTEGVGGGPMGDRMRDWSGLAWEDATAVDTSWYLGFAKRSVVRPDDRTWVGAGQAQYLAPPRGGVLAADVAHDSCPGTSIMTRVTAGDPGVGETVWESQVLLSAWPSVAADDVAIASPFVSETLSLAFPGGWLGVGCPGKFFATSPDRTANVIAEASAYDGTLTDFVDSVVDGYPDQLSGYALEAREPVRLGNGLRAERLTYTWASDGLDVRQVQTFAVEAGSAFLTTVTQVIGEDLPAATMALLLDSFQPAAESIVTAACDDCSPAVLADRQAAIDGIARRLSAIDETHCRDTTGTSDEANAVARVSCTFPSGFEADFVAWKDLASLQAFTDRASGLPGASVQDWFLYGVGSGDRTGITVEWLDGEDARFRWAYEGDLLTGDAILHAGDAGRLNNWWQTTGAIMRE